MWTNMLLLSYLKILNGVVALGCLPVSLGNSCACACACVRVCVEGREEEADGGGGVGGQGREAYNIRKHDLGKFQNRERSYFLFEFSHQFESFFTPWPRTSIISTTLQPQPRPKQTKTPLPKPRLPFQLSLCFLFANVFLLCFVFDGFLFFFHLFFTCCSSWICFYSWFLFEELRF